MPQIVKKNIMPGVVYIEIKEVNLYMCCGCPADIVKHLKIYGAIRQTEIDGVKCETGPNAILLADTPIQHGKLTNLTEFPILQMFYLQGVSIPGHPNYRKFKPLLIGNKRDLGLQLDYVSLGNHGIESIEELTRFVRNDEMAQKIFATKIHYAGGKLKKISDFIDTVPIDEGNSHIGEDVFLERLGVNRFKLMYKDESVEIDLSLKIGQRYKSPYQLQRKQLFPEKYSIIHTGEGNGWDVNRPCMASIMYYNGKVYLLDAGPNITENLDKLGVSLSEVTGIFLSHIHDDHFAGITDLLNAEHRLKLYATKMVRYTARLKISAMIRSEFDLMSHVFDCIDLDFNDWQQIDEGLEVMPSYSPHTVETSIFQFRAADKKGNYKKYLHLADTINFREFDIIYKSNPEIIDEQDVAYLRENYLATVDLKKLDVGGGAIHGHLSDYEEDNSKKLVMAHTDMEIYQENHRFCNASFGDIDHLVVDEDFNSFKSRAKDFLSCYLYTVDEFDIDRLASSEIAFYEPEQEILDESKGIDHIYLIVTGIVKFRNDENVCKYLGSANFLGLTGAFVLNARKRERYIAKSHVCCLKVEIRMFNEVFDRYNLWESIQYALEVSDILRASYLGQLTLSNYTFYRLAKKSEILELEADFTKSDLENNLFVLIEGDVTVLFDEKYLIGISTHQHFGGQKILSGIRHNQRYLINSSVKVLRVPVEQILEVPVLLWKLLEMEEKRYQLSIFETNNN